MQRQSYFNIVATELLVILLYYCNFTLLILFDILVSPARQGLALLYASPSQSTRHFQLELLVA
jgi:hypothetical protein